MEVPSGGVRKVVVVGEAGDGESTESVVVQCTSGGEVEDGEEVVRGEAVGGSEMYACVGELSVALEAYSKMARRVFEESEGDSDEGAGDVVSESEGVSRDGRLRLIDFANESAYWSGRVRTRRCAAPKSYSDVGETFVVDRTPMKRKHEEINECGRVSESELYEDTDSDDSASSSDSDASDSEYEQWNRGATSNKRRRGGEGMSGSILLTNQSLQLSSQQQTVNCHGLKEMQQLLELQLQAAERREAGMKQRMERMMELMSNHVGHVEKRVCNLEGVAEPQEQILERINLKLEKVMEGFTTLNENLSILTACLSRNLDSQ